MWANATCRNISHKPFAFLRPGGMFLNHGIGLAGNRPAAQLASFTDVYVFPDGELVPIAKMLGVAEKCGFEVRDVENLRYSITVNSASLAAPLGRAHAWTKPAG